MNGEIEKTVQFTLLLPATMLREIGSLAVAADRSVTAQIRVLLKKGMEAAAAGHGNP